MNKTLTMDVLYKKLKDFGICEQHVKKHGLPSWWADELNDKPMAVLECSGYISNRFGLDLKSLLSEDDNLKFTELTETKFKQRINSQTSEIAHGLAHGLAKIITYANENTFMGIPNNVEEIRSEILNIDDTINLNSLLNYCWRNGIAVAYFNKFPKRKTKFDGMIQLQSKKPVIILCVNYKESSKLAFVLAHELGHLALGHITEGELFEGKINSKDQDQEEKEANQFAVKLLLGDCDNCFGQKKNFKSVNDFIKETKAITSKNPTVDIASIMLNYAWYHNGWGLAQTALTKQYPNDDGQKLINESLANKLNWDILDDDSYEYLEQVLGV